MSTTTALSPQKRTSEQGGLITSLPPKHRKLNTAPPFANRESHPPVTKLHFSRQ
jgi:hypothetical protein